MCKKCIAHPENRNTRYCDDWWKSTSHGGYAEDRKLKNPDEKEDKSDYWDNDELNDGKDN